MTTLPNITKVFEEQAFLNPEKAAIIYRGRYMSYEELNTASNSVANYLIDNHLYGQFIGISLHRSPDIVISILGILKAGCSYVFIDPAYPAERAKYIIEHSDLKLLFTAESLPVSGRYSGVTAVYVKELIHTYKREGNPGLEILSDSPAYMMYTSGTTGQPKGVILTHGNVLSYINAIKAVLMIDPDDIYLHSASFSFSSSVRQWLVPLSSGIPLCIASEEDLASLKKILEVVKNNHITIIDTTQLVWRYGLMQIERLVQTEKESLIDSDLRRMIFSGDILPAWLVQQIRKTLTNKIKIFNVYGQTEALGATVYPVPEDFSPESGVVPIGYPLDNTRLIVMQEDLTPVEDGGTGELYVCSPSVGPGYYKNSELSNAVFLENHFIDDAPYRVLKTGDIVRFWKNKPLEIIGRQDFQVKIRGIRINLSEIESVLIKHPHVEDCVVTGISAQDNELSLVGIIVTKNQYNGHTDELKTYLRDFLPEAYIPEMIIKIDRIPATPNGKINRKAIVEIAENEYFNRKPQGVVRFRNEVQKTLYNLFVKVLMIDNFTLTDSFFDIGGQSLKAVELVEIMERVFNKSIPVELVYRYPSVEKLASAVEHIHQESFRSNLIAIQPFGKEEPFICVHGDDANFYLPKYFGEEIPFYGYFHQGRNGERIEYTTLRSIAEEYVEELMNLRPKGPYILGGYSIGGIIAFAMAKRIREKGGEVRLLVLIDSESPQYIGERIAGKYFFEPDNNS